MIMAPSTFPEEKEHNLVRVVTAHHGQNDGQNVANQWL